MDVYPPMAAGWILRILFYRQAIPKGIFKLVFSEFRISALNIADVNLLQQFLFQ